MKKTIYIIFHHIFLEQKQISFYKFLFLSLIQYMVPFYVLAFVPLLCKNICNPACNEVEKHPTFPQKLISLIRNQFAVLQERSI